MNKICCKCGASFVMTHLKEAWCNDCFLKVYGESYSDIVKNIKKDRPKKSKSDIVKNIKKDRPKKSKKVNLDFKNYKLLVDFLTKETKVFIPAIHRRGFYSFQIDHKISISFGFHNGIDPAYLAHPSNLWLIWWEDNISKGPKCFVDYSNEWILDRFNINPVDHIGTIDSVRLNTLGRNPA
jgi:hypothetical protein